MKTCLAVLLRVSSVFALPAPVPDVLVKEKESLQGTWVATSLVDSGREEPGDKVKELTLTIKGDEYTYGLGGRSFSAVYKIDPTKKPKEMDVTFKEGPQKGTTMLAVYSLTGNELKICGGDTRPTGLVSEPKSGMVLFIFKRQKP
jgi:uncharacterized protein (TIGR03067 family)